eukprot:gene12607-16992_t
MNGSPGIYKKTARQVSCRINDEVAILDLDRAIYFGLQGVGVHIWDALEQPRSVADLCSSVMAEFDVSEAVFRADILPAGMKGQSMIDKSMQGSDDAAEPVSASAKKPYDPPVLTKLGALRDVTMTIFG